MHNKFKTKVTLVVSIVLATSVHLPAQVTIDTDCPIGPTINYFGWDLKGSQNLANPFSRAVAHYTDTPANLVRIPVFANAHFEDGTINESAYANVLTSLQNIFALNPNVKVFASIKLEGANTFPEWIESNNNGTIFSNNVKRPDPDKYSQLLTDYVEYFWLQGVKIEFFGILNETQNAVTAAEYIETIRLFRDKMEDRGIPIEYRTFEWIGAETYRVTPSINYVNNILNMGGADTLTWGGAHMYSMLASESDDAWLNFADALPPDTPMWHTEVHMNSPSAFPNLDVVSIIRNSYAVLGGSARSGVSGFVWWGRGDSQTGLQAFTKRRAVEIMLGSRPVNTLPEQEVQLDPGQPGDVYQAYRKGNELEIVLFRDGGAIDDFHIDLRGRVMRRFLFTESYQGPGNNLGNTAFEVSIDLTMDSDNSGFTIAQLPADSFTRIKIELGEDPAELFQLDYQNNNQFDNLGGRRFTAFTTSSDNFNNGASAEFGNNVLAVNSNTEGGNNGVGFIYLPTGIEWERNTRYTIDLSVLDRGGQPNDGEIEFGLWSGLPDDDNGGGVFTGDLSGANAIDPITKPSLGTAGQLRIASSSLDGQNGLQNGEWASTSELGCATELALYQQFSFSTSDDISTLEPMFLFLRAARNRTTFGTGKRVHVDNITIFREPLEEFTPPNSLIVTQGIQSGGGDSLNSSDDERVRFILSKTVEPGGNAISIVAESVAPNAEDFLIESRAGTPNLTKSVEFYNWTTDEFDTVNSAPETIEDQILRFPLDSSLHVNTNGSVRARLGWQQVGPVLFYPWNVDLDLIGWSGP